MRGTTEIFRVTTPNGTKLLVSRESADQGRRTRVWVLGAPRDATPDEAKFARAAIRLQLPLWKRKKRDPERFRR